MNRNARKGQHLSAGHLIHVQKHVVLVHNLTAKNGARRVIHVEGHAAGLIIREHLNGLSHEVNEVRSAAALVVLDRVLGRVDVRDADNLFRVVKRDAKIPGELSDEREEALAVRVEGVVLAHVLNAQASLRAVLRVEAEAGFSIPIDEPNVRLLCRSRASAIDDAISKSFIRRCDDGAEAVHAARISRCGAVEHGLDDLSGKAAHEALILSEAPGIALSCRARVVEITVNL